MVTINKCLMGIKTDIASIKTDIADIKKDINGIVPKVDKYGVDIGILKSEIRNVKSSWEEKEEQIDGDIGWFKILTGALAGFDLILIGILSFVVMIK